MPLFFVIFALNIRYLTLLNELVALLRASTGGLRANIWSRDGALQLPDALPAELRRTRT